MADGEQSPTVRHPDDAPKSRAEFVIPDDCPGYPLSLFTIPRHYEDDLESIIIPNGMIRDRIEKLAHDVMADFQNERLTVLCVLKGGHSFFADLIHYIKKLNTSTPKPVPLEIEFIRLKSYENTESTGLVRIIGIDDLASLKGRNLLVVEDMIDTGKTMQKLIPTLEQLGPAKIRCAGLFVKRTPRSCGFRPDYIGFEVPDLFIVGYALDYNEHFRDLQHIALLNDHGKAKYAV